MLRLIETGVRVPGLLMKNRLMNRLGVSVDDYEVYLDEQEYNLWSMRQNIIVALMNEDVNLAEKCLEAYIDAENMENKLCQQFVLAMRAECIRLSGNEAGETHGMNQEYDSDKKLCELYGEAVRLTVPYVDCDEWGDKLLSAQELNLILEYARYSENKERDKLYRNILSYLERDNLDTYNISKIFPKAVYYMYESEKIEEGRITEKIIKKYTILNNRAIECLRKTTRLYYILEILNMKIELMTSSEDKGLCDREQLEKFKSCKKVYEELYEEKGLSGYMRMDMQFYIEGAAYNVSEVIKNRRIMLGISVKKLSEGICSERTMLRIENGQTKNHREIISEILDRLGITYELYRTDIVTDDYEVKMVRQQLDKYFNVKAGYDECNSCISEIEKRVDKKYALNVQTINILKLFNEHIYCKISDTAYSERMIEELGRTVPLERIINSDNMFLTYNEIKYFREIMVVEKNSEIKKMLADKLCLIMDNHGTSVAKYSRIIMYEYIMTTVSSIYGDMQQYDKSNEIADRTLKLCLMCRRTHILPRLIYNNQWNDRTRENREKYNRHEIEEINKCIIISKFTRNEKEKAFFEKQVE